MGEIHITDHPLIQHKISMLRDENTGSKEFRELVQEIAMLISYEATRDLTLTDVSIKTPVGTTTCKQITNTKLGIVPILRAGTIMVDSLLKLIPTAKVGHIGLYRDPYTLSPVEYYCKLPSDCENFNIFLLEPMLATGRTASTAIQFIKERGANNIKLICLIVCKEGINRILEDHPDVDVYTAAYDDELNDKGYVVPGLGDVGDRLFGTK